VIPVKDNTSAAGVQTAAATGVFPFSHPVIAPNQSIKDVEIASLRSQ
jgi:hypothetical protein